MRFLLGCALLVLGSSVSRAEGKAIEAEPVWKGSVDDLDLAKDAPTVITSQKAFAKLWESWKIGDKVPEIDFDKKIVAVTTGRGSQLNLFLKLEEGDLKVNGFGTKDLRDGFRYSIGVLSREGVKTANGKALPKE